MHTYKYSLLSIYISMAASTLALNLSETLSLALQQDVSHKQARATWLSHTLDDKIALSSLLPQSTASFESNKYHANNANTATYRYEKQNLSLSQILFDPEKIALYTEATIDKKIQWLTYQQHEQNFLVYVAGLYFNLLQALDNLEYTQAELSEYKYRYRLAKEQEASGLITHTEALQVLAQMARSEASVIAAERNLRDQKDLLSQSIGEQPNNISTLDEASVYQQTIPELATWVEQSKQHNIAYKISQKQIDIMQTAKNAAYGSFLPTVTSSFSLSRNQNYPQNGYDISKTNQRSLAITAQVPLLTGGKRAMLVAKSWRTLDLAKINNRKTQQDIQVELRELYYSLQATEEFIQAEKKAITADKELLKMNKIRHDVGAVTLVEILDSISRLRQNQQALAKARYSYLTNLLKLKAIAGVIKASDVQDIDRILTKKTPIHPTSYD